MEDPAPAAAALSPEPGGRETESRRPGDVAAGGRDAAACVAPGLTHRGLGPRRAWRRCRRRVEPARVSRRARRCRRGALDPHAVDCCSGGALPAAAGDLRRPVGQVGDQRRHQRRVPRPHRHVGSGRHRLRDRQVVVGGGPLQARGRRRGGMASANSAIGLGRFYAPAAVPKTRRYRLPSSIAASVSPGVFAPIRVMSRRSARS